jgi:steroid delta-isomerase-like uncharacterized protein
MTAADDTTDRSTRAEANRSLVRRFLEELVGDRDPSAVERYVAADVRLHEQLGGGGAPGRESLVAGQRALAQAVPDYRLAIEQILAEGDKVLVDWTVSGTHGGELGGIPATYRPVVIASMTTVRVEADRIVEAWQITDFLTVLQQVGLFGTGRPPLPIRLATAMRGRLFARRLARGYDDTPEGARGS